MSDREMSTASKTSDVHRLVMRIMWGSYEMKQAGLGFIRFWHHNPALQMNRSEQLAENYANVPDFSVEKYLPPAIMLTMG
jgi:hypothetical protein